MGETEKMNKLIFVVGSIVLLICVGLSGCSQSNPNRTTITVTNNYSGDVEGHINIEIYNGNYDDKESGTRVYTVSRDFSLHWNEAETYIFDIPESIKIDYGLVNCYASYDGYSDEQGHWSNWANWYFTDGFQIYGTEDKIHVKWL